MTCVLIAPRVLLLGAAQQIQKALELRHTPTDTEQAAWCLLRSIKFVQKILDAVWSLPQAFG